MSHLLSQLWEYVYNNGAAQPAQSDHVAIRNHLSEKPKICLVVYVRLTQV